MLLSRCNRSLTNSYSGSSCANWTKIGYFFDTLRLLFPEQHRSVRSQSTQRARWLLGKTVVEKVHAHTAWLVYTDIYVRTASNSESSTFVPVMVLTVLAMITASCVNTPRRDSSKGDAELW